VLVESFESFESFGVQTARAVTGWPASESRTIVNACSIPGRVRRGPRQIRTARAGGSATENCVDGLITTPRERT
jgi:hypothetical protein